MSAQPAASQPHHGRKIKYAAVTHPQRINSGGQHAAGHTFPAFAGADGRGEFVVCQRRDRQSRRRCRQSTPAPSPPAGRALFRAGPPGQQGKPGRHQQQPAQHGWLRSTSFQRRHSHSGATTSHISSDSTSHAGARHLAGAGHGVHHQGRKSPDSRLRQAGNMKPGPFHEAQAG